MALPIPPEINQGQIALDPVNGVVYYKDADGNLVSTTWSWLRDDTSNISTDDDVLIDSNLTVSGDLVIQGDTVTLNTAELLIEDNFIILNSNVTGSPTLNAGIEIERGTSPNVFIRWNESVDQWQITVDGTNYYDILYGDQQLLTTSDVSFNSVTADLTGDVTGDVTGTVSDISNHGISDLSDVAINDAANGDFLRYNGSNWINDPVNLTTDTVGDYVSTVTEGLGISVTNTGGEGATPNVALDAVLDNLNDVAISGATPGQILSFDGTNWVNTVSPTMEPIGHEDKSESTISFNEGTRTFSITPVSTSFTVWCAGKRFVKTGTETVEIPDTSGLYYIYYNSSGVLSYRTDYFIWDEDAPTAYVYWNEVDNKAYFFADERHGITLDWATHEYLHRTRGAAIANGFGVNNYILNGDGSLDSHAKLDIADGTFFDEDLQVDITHSNTPTANTWEQVLQGNAEIPVFYRVNNNWIKDVATEFPLKQGASRPQYNLNTAGTWSTTDIANNRFGVSWIIATNNLNEPIIAVLGQGSYTDNGSAEAEFYGSLNLDGFPIVEFRPLYKIIYECKDSYSNTPSARFTSIVDLRSVIAADQGIGTTPVSDHGSMTGLSDDDHTQYLTTARHDSTDHSTVMSSVVLNDISDIQAATPSSDQVLAWNDLTSKWNARAFTAIVASLDDIGDVDFYSISPTEGNVLKFDGVNWTPSTDNQGTSINSLDDIGDVNVPSPNSGEFLRWTGSVWESDTVELDELSNVNTGATPTPGSFLSWDGSQWKDQVIELGNNTIGNYVSDVTAGTGVTVTHTPGEGSSASIAIGQAVGIADNVTFNNINVSSNISLTNGGEITASRASTTDGGSITIKPEGIMDGDIETGGSVYIYGGYAYGLNSVGGSIAIDAGNGLPDNGQIIIGNTYANLISIGRSGKTTQIKGSLEVDQTMSFQQTTEKVNSSSINVAVNIMTCDYTTGAIYYQSTNPSANFTVNFTNVPTTDDKAITFTIFVTQGATGYIPSALQIDGSAQTIKWAQGTQPTPTANKIDIFSFTLIRLSSSWTVFGNANTNF
jgi:hypothetical protein